MSMKIHRGGRTSNLDGRERSAKQRFLTGGLLLTALAALIVAGQLSAVVAPESSSLRDKEFRLAELDIETTYVAPGDMPAGGLEAVADLSALRAPAGAGKIDARSGRWAAITPVEPLVPGTGMGNSLAWESLGFAPPGDDSALASAVGQAFRRYLVVNASALRIDPAETRGFGRVTVHEDGRLAQIHHLRVVDGIPVRGSYLHAVVNSGNLVLFGSEKWGDIDVSTRPTVTSEVAWEVVRTYTLPHAISGPTDKSELILVPLEKNESTGKKAERGGYTYRLAHVIRPSFEGDMGGWEALVDAHSGELISFVDTNQYAEVKGGVLPVSNDGVVPDGVEQPGWPMPFQDISTTSGTLTTDSGGNVAATGSMTATFYGPYVNINDNCGAESLTQNDGIDWGASAGTDCVTPGFGGAGNTHASRTGFYELNKIIEMARGQLPSNSWLQSRLTSNMNINNTCNAFWNGTVNFYRSGGGCANTGELAGVFDHEWGHGMDANDATPGIASPSGEGIADIYTALRLNNSCIGRNFLLGSNCSGNGDPCLNCDGVRDIDYLKRASGNPHTYTWSNANCGGSVHCVGGVYSEAVWSLWKRKLPTLYGYDNNTAHEIVNRLTFIGAGATGTWFSGGPPNGGCAGSSGYMNYLAADDDDGNLNNGTPHMTAIYQAFNDQEIACQTPAVQDSGCAGTPTTAPVVSASPGNQQIDLSWGAVSGASSYEVFRTEGVFACDFGKVKIASTTGTSINDSGLQNGRDYSYVVIPKGPANSCFGPASACTTDQPVGQPDFTISCSPSSFSIAQGDNDTSTCTVISSFGYTGNVNLSCSGNPAGVGCAFAPASVSPPANGSANSTLTLTVSGGQATGTFAFDVVGNDGAINRTAPVSVQVIPAGSNGPQNAVYDSGLGAPKCAVAGSSCDSTTLLDSRDSISPTSEPNQPNTLDVCNDGGSGTYHNDESIDRIVVSTLDGGNFTEGDTVEIATTVYAWSTGTSDHLDLYYTADAMNPSWIYITTIDNPGSGVQTETAQYVLPAGGMQAVRANFRYNGSVSPCSTGAYDDHDDLVFTVEAPGGGCTIDSECDDGLFCNGAETCNAGSCQTGTSIDCSDGVSCTVDSCNESTDSCDNAATDSLCDNGQFCDGAETCDAVLDCQGGAPPAIDDGVGCTDDSCDEVNDVVVHSTNDGLCDNGQFCDGAETCDAILDCQDGTPPVIDDGVGCTDDSCDEVNDVVVHSTNDGLCDNGQFCDGAETCDAVLDCQAGSDPCAGQSCDEDGDACVACVIDADCSDGLFCNGEEVCSFGSCQAGTPPAVDDGVSCTVDGCDEVGDVVVHTPNNGLCDNGQFCDGAETCDAINDCQAGVPPNVDDGIGCTDDGCDEVNDVVVNTTNDGNCDNGLFCDGTEICDAVNDCQAGTDPCGGLGCDEAGDVCQGGGDPVLWMSFRSTTSVPGVGTVRDEDIVSYDEGSGLWQLIFDGSDVGVGGFEIDGLAVLPDGDFLLSFTGSGTIGGQSVDDSDIVRFTPTSLGSSTAGSFSLYFDGSDVGLTSNGEDVDSIALDGGQLVISTNGGFSGTGASGADEDLFLFTGTLGSSTSGSFTRLFDGSDVGLGGNGSEDVDAATFKANGDLWFSTVGSFSASGASGADEDVAEFSGTFGNSTSGTIINRLDLSALGISSSEDIGSMHVNE